MALLDFIHRLLGLQKPSATTAKERLQLVLAHDRSDLNPELLEQMRREILEVVQKYVEIDLEGGDVSLATEDRVTALVANLPIRRAKVAPPTLRPSPSEDTSVPDPSLQRPGDLPPEASAEEATPLEPSRQEASTGSAPATEGPEDSSPVEEGGDGTTSPLATNASVSADS